MKLHTFLPVLIFLLILPACQPVEQQPVFNTSTEVSLTPVPLQGTPPESVATLPGAILSFAISPNDSMIAFATSQGLLLYDLQTYELLQTLAEGEIVNSLAWSPDGTQLAVGLMTALPNPSEFAGTMAVLKIWDVFTWQVILEPNFDDSMINERINDLAFSPDGKRLAFSADINGVMTIDLANGRIISHQKEFAGSVMSLAWSPDGSRLVSTGDMAYSIRRWVVKNDKAVRLFDERAGNPMHVAWTPDGQRIVSGHVNGVVCFWTAASNECDGFIQAHRSAVFSMAISSDGARLATGGGILRIWSTQTGELLSAFGLDEQILYTKIAWTGPDSQLIALETGMENPELTRVRIWDISSGIAEVEFLGGERFPATTNITSVPNPTEIPADWQEFRSDELNLSLHHPLDWQVDGKQSAHGPDGFLQVESRPYSRSLYDQMSHLCVQEANDPASGARYGGSPFIDDWQAWDTKENTWLGYGCIVHPKLPQAGLESVLFARDPARPDDLLVLQADSLHFDRILSSLRFLQVSPEPASSGYYDSPHCHEIPSAPAVSIQQAAGLSVTEYAIANETCHPIKHFDGFRARVNALGINMNTLWKENQMKSMQAANQKLAPFGLRLEERQTGEPWVSFDLKNGDEILFTNLVRLGEVSTRPGEIDFIFWAHAEDKNSSQFPILIYKNGIDTFSVWEEGFNSAWAGNRLISFKYSDTEVFPVGAPASIEIFSNGQPLQSLAIPLMGAAGSPVRGLWNWDGQWVMEIRSTLFVDGQIKNRDWGYDEIFDWNLVNGKPFFAARRAADFTLVYDGEELPITYDDIAHGDVCCEAGLYDFQPFVDGAIFYARRDGIWFLVRVQAIEE